MTDTKTPSDLAAEARATAADLRDATCDQRFFGAGDIAKKVDDAADLLDRLAERLTAATSDRNKMQDIYNDQADELAKAQDEATFKWRTFEARIATIEADLAALRLASAHKDARASITVGDQVVFKRRIGPNSNVHNTPPLGFVGFVTCDDGSDLPLRVEGEWIADGVRLDSWWFTREALDLITPADD